MRGKVIVITGGTSGIGRVAAERLAGLGARIILIARDPERAGATLERLRQAGPDVDHAAVYADLSRIAEMRRAAAEIAAAEPRVDVLINNAGALFDRRELTADGLEMTFAVNHMAYFVVTQGLLGALAAADAARIVSTASGAHFGAKLDFDDLQMARGFTGFGAYARSKLANILFTRELARRVADNDMTANCLHPGFVATRFGDSAGGAVRALMPLARLFALSPEKGADTLVYLAASPEPAAANGLYFVKRKASQPSLAARDDGAAVRLWAESERLLAAASA